MKLKDRLIEVSAEDLPLRVVLADSGGAPTKDGSTRRYILRHTRARKLLLVRDEFERPDARGRVSH